MITVIHKGRFVGRLPAKKAFELIKKLNKWEEDECNEF